MATAPEQIVVAPEPMSLVDAAAEFLAAREALEFTPTSNGRVFDAAMERHERAIDAVRDALAKARGK